MGPLPRRHLRRRALARRRALRAGGFDVAHIIYLNPFTDPLDLASLRRHVPLVSTVHDVVPHHSRVPDAGGAPPAARGSTATQGRCSCTTTPSAAGSSPSSRSTPHAS